MQPQRRFRALLLAAFLAANSSVGALLAAQLKQSTSTKSSASSTNLIAGRRVFARECASCHGLDVRGGERAPNILERPEVLRMSDADIARVIREGTPSKKMPAFSSSLNAPAIRNAAAYLRSLLRGSVRSAHLPGDPASGKTLFFGKAGCVECHMVDGAGGFLGADLSAYASSHSVDEIRGAITNPNKNPDRRERTATVITRGGECFTGIARNEDNFSLQLETPDGAFHLLMKSDLEHIDYPQQSLMPADYRERLDAQELDDLISFLVRAAARNSKRETGSARPQGSDPDR
jgi:cytochrome c oxidase cbb3-type subunit III